MIIDNELVLKESMALTASGNSDSVDMVGMGLEAKQAKVRCLITTAGAGTGTVAIAVQGSDDDSTFVTLETSEAVVGSTLAKGDKIKVAIPANDYKYLRAAVVVTGTVSAGAGFIDVEVG